MQSRTLEGKHTKRFIIEYKDPVYGNGKWNRSENDGLEGFFATREEAQAAIDPAKGLISDTLDYRVRQK